MSLSGAVSPDDLRMYARTIVRSPAYADALAQVVIESGYSQSIDEARRLVVRVHETLSGMPWHMLLS